MSNTERNDPGNKPLNSTNETLEDAHRHNFKRLFDPHFRFGTIASPIVIEAVYNNLRRAFFQNGIGDDSTFRLIAAQLKGIQRKQGDEAVVAAIKAYTLHNNLEQFKNALTQKTGSQEDLKKTLDKANEGESKWTATVKAIVAQSSGTLSAIFEKYQQLQTLELGGLLTLSNLWMNYMPSSAEDEAKALAQLNDSLRIIEGYVRICADLTPKHPLFGVIMDTCYQTILQMREHKDAPIMLAKVPGEIAKNYGALREKGENSDLLKKADKATIDKFRRTGEAYLKPQPDAKRDGAAQAAAQITVLYLEKWLELVKPKSEPLFSSSVYTQMHKAIGKEKAKKDPDWGHILMHLKFRYAMPAMYQALTSSGEFHSTLLDKRMPVLFHLATVDGTMKGIVGLSDYIKETSPQEVHKKFDRVFSKTAGQERQKRERVQKKL